MDYVHKTIKTGSAFTRCGCGLIATHGLYVSEIQYLTLLVFTILFTIDTVVYNTNFEMSSE